MEDVGSPDSARGTSGNAFPDPEAPLPVICVIAYGPGVFTKQAVESPQRVRDFLNAWPVTWVNVEGLGDAAVINQLEEIFGLHRLALEDVMALSTYLS
jgi:magnesium transporter